LEAILQDEMLLHIVNHREPIPSTVRLVGFDLLLIHVCNLVAECFDCSGFASLVYLVRDFESQRLLSTRACVRVYVWVYTCVCIDVVNVYSWMYVYICLCIYI